MRKHKWKYWPFLLALGLLLSSSTDASAGRRHRRGYCHSGYVNSCGTQASCGTCDTGACDLAPAPEPEMVEKTIMVPTTVTETRTIQVTECKLETRQRTYTVMKRVPKTETVTRNYTVMVPKQETKTVNYTVCRPVYSEKTQQYTVKVPYTEMREATRRVCKRVPVTMTKTITVDEGHWETQAPVACDTAVDSCAGYSSGCGSCDNGCGHRHRRRFRRCRSSRGSCDSGCASRVWVSNPVEKEVRYTCYKTQWEDQPYKYKVCLTRPETRERTIKVCKMVNEQKSREVTYTRMVPEERTSSHEVTRYECVPEERTQTYKVRVPYQVEKQVEVRVCKMVPKTITVPAYNNSCGGYSGCRGGCY